MATHALCRSLSCILLLVSAVSQAYAAQISGQDRNRARDMLEQMRDDIEEHYYDPTYGGIDLEAKYQGALQKIDEVPTITHAFGVMAQFMADFGDSHTLFVPPLRTQIVDYGFDLRFIGDTSYVTDVTEGSDAWDRGLRPGDAALMFGPYRVERRTFPTLEYILYVLNPQRRLELVVRKPDGTISNFQIESRVTDLPVNFDYTDPDIVRRFRKLSRHAESGLEGPEGHIHVELEADSVLIWRMPSFDYDERWVIEHIIGEARENRGLVLDLRDNPGGALRTQLHLVGAFFDRPVRVGHLQSRGHAENLVVEPWGDGRFSGELVVLVNSRSASSAEMVARALQLEGRATIVGDRTAGAVMAARMRSHKVGFTRYWRYGVAITVADVIMSDGERLEDVGVVPDVKVHPTPGDLRDRRDPALVRALEVLGVHGLDSETAGRIYDDT